MHASNHSFDEAREQPRWLHLLMSCAILVMLLAPFPAAAHKASDAYLQLGADGSGGSQLRIDVALRDLDAAVDIDADADGRLSWGEVKATWPAISRYVRANVQLAGCGFDEPQAALQRRSDGVYAVLAMRSACAHTVDPVLRYTLFSDIDPTHRGLLAVEPAAGGAAPLLRVLDPQRPISLESQPGVAAPGALAGAAVGFVGEGVRHILTGYDHVLFLMLLLLPSVMRRSAGGWAPVPRLADAAWPVLGIVTAFTLAHSITLALAALGLVSLPAALIEPAIAATIVLAAIDNLRPVFGGRRVLVTFLFGLIHGFGFAGVLGELDLPAWQFAWALLQFNLGLELGQVAIVLIAGGLLFYARKRRLYDALVIRSGSCAAMLIGGIWFIERISDFSLLRM